MNKNNIQKCIVAIKLTILQDIYEMANLETIQDVAPVGQTI